MYTKISIVSKDINYSFAHCGRNSLNVTNNKMTIDFETRYKLHGTERQEGCSNLWLTLINYYGKKLTHT